MKQLKNATLIKAWADGAEIERQADTGEWFIDCKPDWYECSNYRIFQEIKPDIVQHISINAYGRVEYLGRFSAPENLKLTFDGETGALKAAEVIV